MRKLITAVLVAALVFTLVVPSAAFARKGGVPASARGRGHAPASAAAEDGLRPRKPDKGGHGKGAKASDGARHGAGADGSHDATEASSARDQDVQVQERERAGIANALARLQRNLARMQAELEAGQREGLPPGLQRVIAKFLGWLGLDGDASEEPSGGDAGDRPNDELPGSVEPTSTAEPTSTIEPEPVEPASAL